jgi:hypothetical protein
MIGYFVLFRTQHFPNNLNECENETLKYAMTTSFPVFFPVHYT